MYVLEKNIYDYTINNVISVFFYLSIINISFDHSHQQVNILLQLASSKTQSLLLSESNDLHVSLEGSTQDSPCVPN